MDESPPVRLRTRQVGAISSSRHKKDNLTGEIYDEVSHTDRVPVPEDLKNPGYVQVKGGVTKNMGGFESVNVGVSISMPCRAVAEDVEACYRWCSSTVDRMLMEQLNLAMGVDEGAIENPLPEV